MQALQRQIAVTHWAKSQYCRLFMSQLGDIALPPFDGKQTTRDTRRKSNVRNNLSKLIAVGKGWRFFAFSLSMNCVFFLSFLGNIRK